MEHSRQLIKVFVFLDEVTGTPIVERITASAMYEVIKKEFKCETAQTLGEHMGSTYIGHAEQARLQSALCPKVEFMLAPILDAEDVLDLRVEPKNDKRIKADNKKVEIFGLNPQETRKKFAHFYKRISTSAVREITTGNSP